ncbi:hypothetical protein NA57DRAFT_62178 [Rhizodiscina lignyota]|uniref:Uncharacterized protein n=1 Tax=Rhizodiscina lignyota TaxID=1504668 RepID=A0A9P4LZI8_9PEZI|nr:hypothetical protein NA57DRAFT_62178 [Rhizodiscina lignyota]
MVETIDSNIPFSLAWSQEEEVNVETSMADEPNIQRRPSTVYHVYNRRHDHKHYLITPTVDPERQSFWGRRPKRKRKGQKQEIGEESGHGSIESPSRTGGTKHNSTNHYFLHFPTVCFRAPPRTLRLGNSKDDPTVCILHNSFLWRRWRLQLGDGLGAPGVVDGRGVVSVEHDWSKRSGAVKRADTDLEGYKLRTWRSWGESGKRFHRDENAHREAAKESKSDVPHAIVLKTMAPTAADEVVYLSWTSPFSHHTRRYHFHFRGVDFYWKGTGTVKESHFCGIFVRFNHLKLVAKVPLYNDTDGDEGDALEYRDIFLAKYTCSVKEAKAGMLEIYDAAVERFVSEYLSGNERKSGKEFGGIKKQVDGAPTMRARVMRRMHTVIVATAMCMIIGERQKRETIKEILIAAASEGAQGSG